jgi:uncharacterized protein (DUF305 family)
MIVIGPAPKVGSALLTQRGREPNVKVTAALQAVPALAAPERRAIEGKTDVRTTAIRGTAAAVLLSATVLGLAGCVNAERPAAPGAGNNQSFGNPPSSSQPASSAPASVPVNPSAPPSEQSSTPTTTAAHHNQTDVTFTKHAVLLRQQALTMADAAAKSSTDSRVRALAGQISKDAVSVNTLTTWLAQWGQAAPTSNSGAGVLSTNQLRQLTSAKGISFDMQWLQFMRANLAAARQATATEASHGSSPQVKQLAKTWAAAARTEASKLSAIG